MVICFLKVENKWVVFSENEAFVFKTIEKQNKKRSFND